MKKSIINVILFIVPTIVLVIVMITSCKKNTTCNYTPCNPTCNLFQNFESYNIGSAGNWQAVALSSLGVVNKSASKKLYMQDASGGSNAYNEIDFPKNLIKSGCELVYDVEYTAGSSNGTTAANSIGVYQGTWGSFTKRAFFRLKAPHLIVDGATAHTIKVPLLLASGSSLPSNVYGDWVLVGGSSTPTPTDIADFNNLIQNINGVYFPVDNGSNPVEEWWYDSFCFTQCCP